MRYIVSIPRQWASFEFDCIDRTNAIKFFEGASDGDEFATLYAGRKSDSTIVAYRANGRLIINGNDYRLGTNSSAG